MATESCTRTAVSAMGYNPTLGATCLGPSPFQGSKSVRLNQFSHSIDHLMYWRSSFTNVRVLIGLPINPLLVISFNAVLSSAITEAVGISRVFSSWRINLAASKPLISGSLTSIMMMSGFFFWRWQFRWQRRQPLTPQNQRPPKGLLPTSDSSHYHQQPRPSS